MYVSFVSIADTPKSYWQGSLISIAEDWPDFIKEIYINYPDNIFYMLLQVISVVWLSFASKFTYTYGLL